MKNTPHYPGNNLFLGQTNKFIYLAIAAIFSTLFLVSCTQDEIQVTPADQVAVDQNKLLTLVPDPQEPIEIQDLVPQELRATQAPGEDRGRFNITLKYVVPVTPAQEQVFEDAAARWERIIIKDVPSIEGPFPSAFVGVPPIEGVVDDMVIEVAIAPIDGPGGILGQAGPRFVRLSDFLTITGVMFFDVADLADLDSLGLFEEVIVHEMGHVLGFGTLWNTTQFGFDRELLVGTFEEPYYAGRKANVFWNAEGGEDELPIENIGGPGTRFGHWREATMGNELMTGFLNLGENPLSRITAGSMRDLGYGSASVGESYDLPRGTPGVDPDEPGGPGDPALHIAAMEELLTPIGFVSTKKKK